MVGSMVKANAPFIPSLLRMVGVFDWFQAHIRLPATVGLVGIAPCRAILFGHPLPCCHPRCCTLFDNCRNGALAGSAGRVPSLRKPPISDRTSNRRHPWTGFRN